METQPVHLAICLDAAIDGRHKPYICPARVVLANGTPTDEVILQMYVTDCITRQLDCYARKDDGIVYRIRNFPKVFRKLGKYTDHRYHVDYEESKLQFLDFIKTQGEYKRIDETGKYLSTH